MAFSPSKHFRLGNVRLMSSSFATLERIDLEPVSDDDVIQTRRWNEAELFEGETPGGEKKTGLFVTVNLGLRRVRAHDAQAQENAQETVLYCIEAAFLVDFEVIDKAYSEDDVQHFSDANACHIVWPFWREHVFRTLRDAVLPATEVPLLAPVPPRAATVSGSNS